MRKLRKYLVMAGLTLLLTAALAVVGLAASPMEVRVEEYIPEEGFLRLNFVQEDAEGSTAISSLSAPEGWADGWTELKAGVRTLWITGDISSFGSATFDGFTGVTCLILDAPNLSTVHNSDLKTATQVFLVESESARESVLNALGNSTARRVLLESTEELCKVTAAECEHGVIVTDAGSYEKRGTAVHVSALPDPGWELRVSGGSLTRIIDGDTEFTADAFPGRELLNENSYGSCGPQAAWFLYENGELRITGLGALTNNSSAARYPWYVWSRSVTALTVDEGITGIPDSAFQLPLVSEFTLPESIESIGKKAFQLPLLREITFPASIRSFGDNAFVACKDLRRAIFLGDCPAALGRDLFPYTEAGRFLVIYQPGTAGWENALTDAVENCYPTVVAGEPGSNFDYTTLERDGDAYRNGQGIVFTLDRRTYTASVGTNSGDRNNSGYIGHGNGQVLIPDTVSYGGQSYTVTYISKNAFSDNHQLRSIHLGASLRDVATGAFYDCSSFEEFIVDEDSESFLGKDGLLYDRDMVYLYVVPGGKLFNTYELPSSVMRIWTGAFQGCRNIRKVEINTGVEVIGDEAFRSAVGIQEIYISSDVIEIGNSAFKDCTGLTTLYIYEGVEKIGSSPFSGCTSLRTLTVPFLGTAPDQGGSLASMFNMNASIVPVRTVTVAGGTLVNKAFYNCIALNGVSLWEDLEAIPQECFRGCSGLRDLDLGAGGGNGLVVFGENIVSIGKHAFLECTSFRRFEVSEDNAAYDSDFWGALYTEGYAELLCYPPASEYQYYCVKGSAESISSLAFSQASYLVTINIPNSGTVPASDAFKNSDKTDIIAKICVHKGSEAERVLGTVRVWIIDYFFPQRIEIQRLSDTLAFETGIEPAFSDLYFIARYSGTTILLDPLDYTLSYSSTEAGPQTVTATYNQPKEDGSHVTVCFRIHLFRQEADKTVLEYPLDTGLASHDDLNSYIAFYDFEGKMVHVSAAAIIDNVSDPDCNILHCAVYVPASLRNGSAVTQKLFLLDGLCPVSQPITELWPLAPVDPRWGTVYYADGTKSAPRFGQISWDPDPEDVGSYRYTVYKRGALAVGEDLAVFTGGGSRQGGHYTSDAFMKKLAADPALGSGTYYFEVVSELTYQGRTHSSLAVRSEDFIFEASEETLAPCTGLLWGTDALQQQQLIWDLPEDTEHYGGYTVTFYYRRWTSGSWRKVGSRTFHFDTEEAGLEEHFPTLSREFFQLNENRPGYYAFTVTAETDDITAVGRSPESEMSDFFYYEYSIGN